MNNALRKVTSHILEVLEAIGRDITLKANQIPGDMTDERRKCVFFVDQLIRLRKIEKALDLLVSNGMGEPSAILLRAIYETRINVRWVRKHPEKVSLYFQHGVAMNKLRLSASDQMSEEEQELARQVNELISANPEDYNTWLNSPFISWTKISFRKRYEDVFPKGDSYKNWYSLLSGFVHGDSRSGQFNVIITKNGVGFKPSYDPEIGFHIQAASLIYILDVLQVVNEEVGLGYLERINLLCDQVCEYYEQKRDLGKPE